ncbi:uncharacterized protein [Rutidosis leptorrhynchoides]|uniref:uncharacterized protein n=1 Tax=Rutidosis leptorrhynchoides TaxID=125765 RepID=UPI003A99E7F3
MARRCSDSMDISFSASMCKTVQDGSSTAFWTELWLGYSNLCQKFPRLFKLESSSGSATATFDWVRVPNGRTKTELDSLVDLLAGYTSDSNNTDVWRWTLASNGRFTVKKLSVLIDEHILGSHFSSQETLRNNLVPKKLEIFAWRVRKKRIPVRTELDKRGIHLHSVRCPLCDDDVESVDHSLIFCTHAIEVWNRVFGWWGIGNFTNFSIDEILSGKASGHMSSLGAKVWQAIGCVSVYFFLEKSQQQGFSRKIADRSDDFK